MRLVAILTTSCLLLVSCSTVSVSRDVVDTNGNSKSETESVPGIPFYVKKLKARQETKWSETAYDVIVTVTATDKDKKPLAKYSWSSPIINVSESLLLDDKMTKLRKAVSLFSDKPSLPREDVAMAIRKLSRTFDTLAAAANAERIARAARPNGLPSAADVNLVSNKLTEEIVVDTTIKYYANGRHPAVGTGKANFELNKDMTLSKVESEVSGDILKTFLDLLPVEEFFTKQWALTGKTDAAADPTLPDIAITVSLKVTPKTTIYTLSKGAISVGVPIPIAAATTAGTSFEVSVVKPSSSSDKKRDDKNTVKIDASVKLPAESSNKK